jgi:hypothetical protein
MWLKQFETLNLAKALCENFTFCGLLQYVKINNKNFL